MRLKNLVRIGMTALIVGMLAACASQDARTQPVAPPGYVSPSQIGPALPEDAENAEQNGDTGGEAAPTAGAK